MDQHSSDDGGMSGIEYGANMAAIGVGALSEILFPFGEPEWLGSVDPKGFNPK